MSGKPRSLLFIISFYSTFIFALSDDELTKLIDHREYQRVVNMFPVAPTGAEASLVFKAYAELGLAGFEPLSLIQKVRAVQSISKDDLLHHYFLKCNNVALGKKLEGPLWCTVVRLFNNIPHHTNESLMAARSTLRLLRGLNRLGNQDKLLLSIVELSFVLSKLRESLYIYNSLDPQKISREDLRSIFETIASAGKDMEHFMLYYKDVEVLLNFKLFGSKSGFLFEKDVGGRVKFMQKTGLPMLFRVTDYDLETTTEIVGRNIIIQTLDRADQFFRTHDEALLEF